MAITNENALSETNKAFQNTYNSSSGCDIVASIDGIVLGNLNGISFSTTREKSPIYVVGQVDPVSYSRGKRGHAGSLIFTNFDRAALYDIMNWGQTDDKRRYWYWAKNTDIPAGGRALLLNENEDIAIGKLGVEKRTANYADQIPPFTISLTALNEYGNMSVMHILGCELINEGSGISIDDIVTETQMTFVARNILGWKPLGHANTADGTTLNNMNYNSKIAEKLQSLESVRAAAAVTSDLDMLTV